MDMSLTPNQQRNEDPPSASIAKQQQKLQDYEARKEHSNSGSNTHSGKGMEYVTRKTHSSRKDEEGLGREVVHNLHTGQSHYNKGERKA